MTTPTPQLPPVDARPRPAVPYRGRTTLLTLLLPLAIAAATVALPWSWRDELPDPVATHWGTHGVDGFGSYEPQVIVTAAIIAVAAIALWAVGFFAGRQAIIRRTVVGISLWFAGLLSIVVVGGLDIQRGLADAHDTGSLNGILLLSFGVATVLALGGAFLVPGDPAQPSSDPVPPTAARLPLGAGEAASWVQRVSTRGYIALAVGVTAFTVFIGVLTRAWIFGTVFGLVLGAAIASFMRWTVVVDRDGLTVRPGIGRPRIRIPLDEVESASVIDVRPIAEFGGYGVRGGKGGRVGVVVRKGEALQVDRTGGRVFLVTVDDAATGAALLNTLAARTRG